MNLFSYDLIMSSKKRVLIVAADFKPMIGGVSEFAYHMACGFARLDAQVLILSPHYPGAESYDEKLGMHIKRTYPSAKVEDRLSVMTKIGKCASLGSLAATMLRMRKSFRPHIIYLSSMYPFAGFFPYSKANIVTTFHGSELLVHCQKSRLTAINKHILIKSCRNSSLILANSNYTKNLLEGFGVCTSKVFVTACGVDWQKFSGAPTTQKARAKLGFSGRRIVFSLGRLDRRKGFNTVVKCMPNIRKKIPDVLYVIAGQGPMSVRLEKLVDELDLHDSVRLVGRISDEDVVNYMAACDVFAMPNRKETDGTVEGFGIVFLEANCCCKPVIAGRSGGAVDAVEHNRTGLLVDPYSQQSIEDAIETLLTNPQLAMKMGQQGRERVEKDFKWEIVAERACRRIFELL